MESVGRSSDSPASWGDAASGAGSGAGACVGLTGQTIWSGSAPPSSPFEVTPFLTIRRSDAPVDCRQSERVAEVHVRLHSQPRNPLRMLSRHGPLSPVDVRLETARLVLRWFTEADVDDITALLGNAEVTRYTEGRPITRAEVETRTLPEILRQYRDLPHGMGRFAAADKATGTFVGWFSLRPADSRGLDGGTELGYRMLPAHWGQGYATEGARALVDSAFRELGADRVVATTMTVNVGSRRVLEKAGLRYLRTFFLDWPEYLEGAEHGDVEYALTRAEWAAGGAAAG